MERLDKGKALREVSQNKKARKSAGEELDVNYQEGSYRADGPSEILRNDSTWFYEDDLQLENLVSDAELDLNCQEGSHRAHGASEILQKDLISIWVYEDDLQWENLVSDFLCKDVQEQRMKREREAVKDLPEELVEKILALLPYPYVFKARVLSKSWLAKMSPVSSQVDEEKKQCATVFQKQIMERSINWKTSCLFYFGSVEGFSNAFDPTTRTWPRFPSLSFLPHSIRDFTLRDSSSFATSFATAEQIEGSLLLWSTSSEGGKELYVANILTRAWKALPPRPYGNVNGKTILVHMIEKYQVIHLHDDERSRDMLQIFDSTVAAWTCIRIPRFIISYPVNLERIAYLDGILYIVSLSHIIHGYAGHLGVLAVKATTVTLEEQFNVAIGSPLREYSAVHVVICDARHLVLIAFGMRGEIQVVKFDLTSLKSVVFSGPSQTGMLNKRQRRVVSDGQWIFIYMERGYDPVLVDNWVLGYNLHEEKWYWVYYHCINLTRLWEYLQLQMEGSIYSSSFHWIRGSFRPGLNPFLEV